MFLGVPSLSNYSLFWHEK